MDAQTFTYGILYDVSYSESHAYLKIKKSNFNTDKYLHLFLPQFPSSLIKLNWNLNNLDENDRSLNSQLKTKIILEIQLILFVITIKIIKKKLNPKIAGLLVVEILVDDPV